MAEANAIARRPYHRTIQAGRVQYEGLTYFSHALATMHAQGIKKVKILVDELDMNTVFVEHPNERGSLILAESTQPQYTSGLTFYAHVESMKIKKAMSDSDRRELGPNANNLARWQLIQQVQSDSQLARKKIRSLTAGLGRKTHANEQTKVVTDAARPLESVESSFIPAHRSPSVTVPHSNGTWENPLQIQTLELE